ncbi:MAG: hypothetical protein EP334_03250 [Gammaproteobacteria bacterium]|nr:MAG: hypothetical protein EP334_03250 [Gammaproteobacteria bacterium]
MNHSTKSNTPDGPGGEEQPDFHGAAVIDAEGNEIPITEDMVQEAFEELEELEEQEQSSDDSEAP